MKAELKAKWIAALRSGHYKQTDGQLRDGDKFCCLGVLCEVAGVPRKGGGYEDGHSNAYCILPTSLERELEDPYTADILVAMNDRDEASFSEIADWIEANVEAQ